MAPFADPEPTAPLIYHVTRRDLETVVERRMAEFHYTAPGTLEDLRLACQLVEGTRHVIVLLCGTSGTGKSTLASLLAARLGIRSLASTDSIRHMMRAGSDDPLLHASTYSAAEALPAEDPRPASQDGASTSAPATEDAKQRTVRGYRMQCDLLQENIELLVESCARRRTSVLIEGVHMTPKLIASLARRHPDTLIPFIVGISNGDKHRERFSVRSKYMATDPARNRYIAHFDAIRTIQEYLKKRAGRAALPWIENTNMDRSVAAAHATVFACVRRASRGLPLWDAQSDTAGPVAELWAEHTGPGVELWSSKQAIQVIRLKLQEKAAMTEGGHADDSRGGGAGEGRDGAQGSDQPTPLRGDCAAAATELDEDEDEDHPGQLQEHAYEPRGGRGKRQGLRAPAYGSGNNAGYLSLGSAVEGSPDASAESGPDH